MKDNSMMLKLVTLRLYVICDRCGVLSEAVPFEKEISDAADLVSQHMFSFPKHKVRALVAEREGD